MKILRKLLVIVPSAIVVLLIAVVVVVGLFADRAVKLGIEKAGSAALPVDIKVAARQDRRDTWTYLARVLSEFNSESPSR